MVYARRTVIFDARERVASSTLVRERRYGK